MALSVDMCDMAFGAGDILTQTSVLSLVSRDVERGQVSPVLTVLAFKIPSHHCELVYTLWWLKSFDTGHCVTTKPTAALLPSRASVQGTLSSRRGGLLLWGGCPDVQVP